MFSPTTIPLFSIFAVFASGGLAECPDGYEGHVNFCYKLLPVKATWAEAQRYCEAVGGDLAVITDDQENTFIDHMLSREHAIISTPQVWIGGTDLLQEGTFLAPKTLEPLTYFKWAKGEPDNVGTGQHCIALFNTDPLYLWDDGDCENKFNPLCKRAKSVDNAEIIG